MSVLSRELLAPAWPARSLVVSPARVQVDVVRDAASWSGLSARWDALLGESVAGGPFLTWDWLDSWKTHLGPRTELTVRSVRVDGELVGAVPFAIFPPELRAGLPTRTLRFMGSGDAGSDYLDVIARRGFEDVVLDALADDCAGQRMPIVLGALRREPCVAMGLVSRLAARGWSVRATRWSICPFAPLAGRTWETYLKTLGGEHRYAVRRAMRGLESHFDVGYEDIRTEARRREVLPILAALHERRWRRARVQAAFRSEALRRFHEEASRRFMERGRLRLSLLSLDRWPVAAVYGIVYGDAFHFYQSGFDPAFASWSVGVAAMAASIRGAIAEGASEYDFLHGAERYKFHWTRRFRRLRAVELYPPDRGGRMAMHAGAFLRRSKSAARRLLTRVSV